MEFKVVKMSTVRGEVKTIRNRRTGKIMARDAEFTLPARTVIKDHLSWQEAKAIRGNDKTLSIVPMMAS